MDQAESFARLVDGFRKLPGIGRKSAERLAFHVLKMPLADVEQLAKDLYETRKNIRYCEVCGNLAEGELCPICADAHRDHGTICVVKDIQDVAAIEKTGEYRGVYHVLGGSISPGEGVFPEDINIPSLLDRAREGADEVILATSTDVPGQATASYLQEQLRPMNVKVSRIAYGIPVGTSLQYADEVTLVKALDGRRTVD